MSAGLALTQPAGVAAAPSARPVLDGGFRRLRAPEVTAAADGQPPGGSASVGEAGWVRDLLLGATQTITIYALGGRPAARLRLLDERGAVISEVWVSEPEASDSVQPLIDRAIARAHDQVSNCWIQILRAAGLPPAARAGSAPRR